MKEGGEGCSVGAVGRQGRRGLKEDPSFPSTGPGFSWLLVVVAVGC